MDALNCENGCICGTAVNPEKSKTDDALYEAKARGKARHIKWYAKNFKPF